MKKILIGIVWVLFVLYGQPKKEHTRYYYADPATLTLIAIAATATGTVLAVQARRQQTKSSKATAKFNAALAQQKADEQRRAGKLQTEAKRKRTQRLLSTQRTQFAKGGVTPVGTPLSVQSETAKNEALNALGLGREFEISARDLEAQGSLFSTQASNIGAAGRLAVGAELVGGVGSIAQIKRREKELE